MVETAQLTSAQEWDLVACTGQSNTLSDELIYTHAIALVLHEHAQSVKPHQSFPTNFNDGDHSPLNPLHVCTHVHLAA